VLTIKSVVSLLVIATVKIGCYDIDELSYEESPPRLILTGVVPLTVVFEVSSFGLTVQSATEPRPAWKRWFPRRQR
jgi:hypothetical protein